jgi:hypothetical protein
MHLMLQPFALGISRNFVATQVQAFS